MRFQTLSLSVVLLLLGACASPPNVLKVVTTGGDAHPKTALTPTGQVDISSINIGDTVVFAPGSMRAVVASPALQVTLIEPASTTATEMKKALAVNRRDGAKIEVMKGKLFRGDIFLQSIPIDLQDPDPKKFDVDITLLAFNRGEKAFRGDLTIFDAPPPELNFIGFDPPAKYNDRRSIKGFLDALPLIQLLSMGMDNFSRSNEAVDVVHQKVDGVHRYTFRRMVLEPGQAVGFVMRFKYLPPNPTELEELRQDARPVTPAGR